MVAVSGIVGVPGRATEEQATAINAPAQTAAARTRRQGRVEGSKSENRMAAVQADSREKRGTGRRATAFGRGHGAR